MDTIALQTLRVLGWLNTCADVPLFWAHDDSTGSIRTGKRPLVEFLLVTAGSFEFTVGDRTRLLHEGDCALFNAHFDNHGELRDGADRYACVSLTIGNCSALRDLADTPLFEVVRVGDRQLVRNHYSRVVAQRFAPASPVRAFRLKAAVLDLLGALAEESLHPGPKGSGVSRALQFIRDHHDEPGLTLGRIAESSHVTAAYLCRLVKAQTGMSPMRYLEQVRIRRAADLLRRTTHDIKRVSYTVGYRDQLYFSRVFRRHMGRSPRAYRSEP
jgi:AraC-like DNA-binding protein